MEHFSNDHEDCSSQQENSHNLCDETGHPLLSLTKHMLQQSELSNGGKAIVVEMLASEEIN